MDIKEHIISLEKSVETYENLRKQYSDNMETINNRIEYLSKVEGYPLNSQRLRALIHSYQLEAESLRGVMDYLTVIKERLEAAKNDPNYDYETWCSSKAKTNY